MRGRAGARPERLPEILIDTHILLWIRREPRRLSAAQIAALEGAQRRLVSVASLYEIGRWVRQGRLDLAPGDMAALPGGLEEIGLSWAPLGPAEMLRAAAVDWEHRDPFDRMILAAAEARGCPLVSADARLSASDMPFGVEVIG